jgi:putative SOS response-associated peptidase YedK
VPADGLYYWKKVSKKGKIPYRLILNNQEVFYMAAIWDEFDQDGQLIHTFNILTMPSNESVREFSPTMPVIFSLNEGNGWLKGDNKKLEEQIDDKRLFGSYPVSSKINNMEIDQADLIKQSSPMDQFGNYSLFD